MRRRVCLEKVEEYNKKSYIKFESIFASELCRYQSRIKPDVSSEWIRWYYIKYDNKYIGSIWLEKNKDDKFADLGVFIAVSYTHLTLPTIA